MIQHVSSVIFLKAFADEWNDKIERCKDELMSAYSNNTEWTRYVSQKGNLLSGVLDRIKSHMDIDGARYYTELYTIDGAFVGGEDLFREDLTYPSIMRVLIEHENGMNIEEEMWKLIFWRAPLKVIIFYDYNEDEKIISNVKREWCEQKLIKLKSMLDAANKGYPESENTEYLFLIGNRDKAGGEVFWKWALINSRTDGVPTMRHLNSI